jgi:hypothetical protein
MDAIMMRLNELLTAAKAALRKVIGPNYEELVVHEVVPEKKRITFMFEVPAKMLRGIRDSFAVLARRMNAVFDPEKLEFTIP